MPWAFGYVRHADPAHKYIQTVNYYLDMICVALGAREAEKVFLSDISLGATGDLQSADDDRPRAGRGPRVRRAGRGPVPADGRPAAVRHPDLSPKLLEELDERVRVIVEEQRQRAEKIISENKAMVETLRDLLLENKTIDAKVLTELEPEKTAKKAKKIAGRRQAGPEARCAGRAEQPRALRSWSAVASPAPPDAPCGQPGDGEELTWPN